jgi:ABC-2 type transport system permease protein
MEVKILHEIKSHLSLMKAYFIINGKTMLEYRKSFILQTVTMFLNDCVWIFFWWLFFSRFPLLNDWTYRDLLLLWAFGATGFGLSGLLFGNKMEISSIVAEGKLDYFLALPKNVLLHTIISKMNWFAFGDLLFGVIIAIIVIPVEMIPLAIYLTILSTILFTLFGVISGSLALYIGNAERISKNVYNAVIGLSIYPTNVYDGIAKIILFTVIPAGLVTGAPVELIRHFDWGELLGMTVITIIFAIITILLFYKGIKKYESGNQLYVNA